MLEFIKMFGLGILYTILFPFILVIFVLYLIYVLFNYLVLEMINFFGFFFGYTFTPETALEKKLHIMKQTVNVKSQDVVETIEVDQELKGSDYNE